MARASQEELEVKLSRHLLKAAELQESIWDGLEALQARYRGGCLQKRKSMSAKL